ncbi:unnamed protein product [Fusarium graminearum]|nr:unnamed protein product [Fusarium graminearum]
MNLLSGYQDGPKASCFHLVFAAWLANGLDIRHGKVIMVTLNDDSIGIVLEQHEGGFIRCTGPVEGFTAGKPEDFE